MAHVMERDDWRALGIKLFGKDVKLWRFVCPSCGHVQTIQDFLDAKIEAPETKVFFSCIGRWINTEKVDMCSGKSPCNYTAGGLFNLCERDVKDENDKPVHVFLFDGEQKKKEEVKDEPKPKD